MKIRILIVDDEQLALVRLGRLLKQLPDVEIVGALDSACDAVAAVDRNHPDLVLLDIEMPLMDGFDVVEALERHSRERNAKPPLIAFVTAYPHFATEAFDTGAIDFICKPPRLPRLEKMLARARTAIAAQDAARRLHELRANLSELREATAHVDERHFWVRDRGELVRIKTSDVEWIEANGAYVQLHLASRSYLVRNAIGSLAKQLADEGYVRVHKSALVNCSRVVRVKNGAGLTALVLQGGAHVRVGRKYRSAATSIFDAAPLTGRRLRRSAPEA